MNLSSSVEEAPEEVLATMDRDGKRRWIYPTTSRGRLWWRRLVMGWGLMALFVALPLIRIGGKPAVLLDIAASEFHLFGLTLYSTDTLLLMLFMLTVLVAVFLFTSLLGRVWCGWMCPQTVYLEFVFRPIEQLIEGKPNQRKRRDEGPNTFDKIWRKALKWTIYSALALALAHTFVAYFVGWDRLLLWLGGSPLDHWGFFLTMAITTGLILFDFGIFREQMCTLACPYARLQSVMMDRDSLIVSYDPYRGEPRGRRSREERKAEEQGIDIPLGDCIDCGACVRTCPTGIDIRNGLQMECVSCTQCIDACDYIMISIGKPVGLIRYTSENQLEWREDPEAIPADARDRDVRKPRVIRPRVVAYAALMVTMIAGFIGILMAREVVEVNIGRAVGAPYTVLPTGEVANRVRFRVQNRSNEATTFVPSVLEPEGVELKVVGQPFVRIGPGDTARFEAWVMAPTDVFTGGQTAARFGLDADRDALDTTANFTLLGP